MPALLPPTPETPESLPRTLRSPALPDLPQTVADTRQDLGPMLQVAADHAVETAEEAARRQAERQNAARRPEPIPVEPQAPFSPLPDYSPVRHQDSASKESVVKGAATTGLAAAGISALVPYGETVVAPMAAQAAAGFLPSAGAAGISLGIPAAGAAVGYYLGKKVGHPAVGSLTGAGVGAAASLAAVPYLNAVAAGAVTSEAAFGGVGILPGLGVLGSVGSGAALAAGGWAVNYGLGRWHEHVWGSKRSGFWKTNLRGLIGIGSIPLGYILKATGRQFAAGAQAV